MTQGERHAARTATSTAPILPLPPEVVERIAAGEVIERPASAVRELIENALDAEARAIRVEIREGGMRLVRVADDGTGIAPEQLAAAVRPHTTSKLRSLDELGTVATLGFRGEALASIAAMAEVELASAVVHDGLGATLTLHAGQVTATAPVPRPRGTTVSVRDLFAAVPSRRALLRSPRAEEARVLRVVRAYALAHPAVRFSLVADGLLLAQTPGTDLRDAIAALYGAEAAAGMVALPPVAVDDLRASGVVGSRALTFARRDQVLVVLNGRPVANRRLLTALESGYRPLLRKGRHPLAVVHVHAPTAAVDVNVHPAKAEVLLRGEEALAAALRRGMHEALGTLPQRATVAGSSPRFALPLPLRMPARRQRRGLTLREGGAPGPWLGDAAEQAAESPLRLTALAQFEGTLLLGRSEAGHLLLVDQHRAHERVLYERLRQARAALEQPRQLLLEPLLVELTGPQAALLLPRLAELAALGLECLPFGGSVFLVRAVPGLPGSHQQAAAFAGDLLRDAAEDDAHWLDAVCISLACRSAIRRGMALAPEEQSALLADLAAVTTPAVCPHGSPLLLRYTAQSLARSFGW